MSSKYSRTRGDVNKKGRGKHGAGSSTGEDITIMMKSRDKNVSRFHQEGTAKSTSREPSYGQDELSRPRVRLSKVCRKRGWN